MDHNINENQVADFIERYGLVITLLIAVVLTLTYYIRFPICYDDAYITFRYAKRIAEGMGFTYNDGIRTLGTTTPLFTLVLAAISKVIGVQFIPEIARIIGLVCFILSAFLIYRIASVLINHRLLAILTAFVYATYPPSVESSGSGMEIPLFIALILLTFLLFLKNKLFPVGWLCGLMLAVRPDAIVWTGAIGVALLTNPKDLMRFVIGFMMVAIPAVVIVILYFGHPLPLSIVAKQVSYGSFYHLDWENLINVFGVVLPNRFAQHPEIVIIFWMIVLLTIIYLSRSFIKHRNIRLIPLIAYIVLYPLFLWYGRTLMFVWYGYPLFPIFVLIAILIANDIFIYFKSRYLKALTILIMFSWSAMFIWRIFIFEPAFGQGGPGMIDLEQWGMYFREQTEEDATIFTESIPQVGYISGRHIICEVGLVSPEVVKIKQRYGDRISESNDWYFDVLRELKPDYLLIHAHEFDKNELFPYEDLPLFDSTRDSVYFYDHYKKVSIQDVIESGDYTGILTDRYYLFRRTSD
ncbi:MAG: hypothetical protein GF315_01790 [candidate division Zixibacteria bacterium]|nr:hypothetical protein [candidate division Zixibacteria bacterium]